MLGIVGPIAFVVQIEGVPAEDEMQPMLRGAAPAQADEEAEVLEEVQLEEDEGAPQAPVSSTPEGEFDPMAFLNGSSDSGTMDALGEVQINDDLDAGAAEDEIVNLEEDADSRHDSAV